MAVVIGTSAGFLTIAPTDDPAGWQTTFDNQAFALKATTPINVTKVTEIGWYCDNATEDENFSVAIYSHDSINDVPKDIIGSSTGIAKGTTAGWKSITGLNITISASTTYWIAVQLDNTAKTTNTNYSSVSGGAVSQDSNAGAGLKDPWTSSTTSGFIVSNYAIISAETGTNMKINIGDSFKAVSAMKINIGDVWKDVTSIKQNIGDSWNTVF